MRREAREEEELDRLIEQKEKEKQEAKRRVIEEAERAKANAKAAVASLLPSKLFGNKEDSKEPAALSGITDTVSNDETQASGEIVPKGNTADESGFKSLGSEQASA